MKMDKSLHEAFDKLGREVTGPILFQFVRWILEEAGKYNIHILYFLARDGYVLKKIAEYVVSTYKLPVVCKYLYCSRSSLRTPTYHLIGEEAFDLLSLGGYCVTLNSLLERAKLDAEQRAVVLKECGLLEQPCARPLSKAELREITQRLRDSRYYRECVIQNAKEAYPAAVGYLRQEGLFDCDHIAIVDSGWTGSMQRSLRQLLESAGYSGMITGFYFGLYALPKEPRDGNYLSWYFHARGNIRDKILFCNNLFECILSAPHGMTQSYREVDSQYLPILLPGPSGTQLKMIEAQLTGILRGMEAYMGSADWENANTTRKNRHLAKKFRRLMTRPSMEEAATYGAFMFNDDISDLDRLELAGQAQVKQLRLYLLHNRLLRKLGEMPPIQELFWPYGVIAFLPKWKQAWYRWNIFAWETMKYLLKH